MPNKTSGPDDVFRQHGEQAAMDLIDDAYLPSERSMNPLNGPDKGSHAESGNDQHATRRPKGAAHDQAGPNGSVAEEPEIDIITRIERFIRLYLHAPEAVYLPLAVYFVATHVADVFHTFPYGGITSPTKSCGKTRVLELAYLFFAGAQIITAASVAAAFRMLGNCLTLLWDECESFTNKHRSESTDLIIQIFNVGYKKGATVPRADGPNHAVVPYPVFGPKMFTAIRDLPVTLADRSIRFHLQKRPKNKKLTRWKEKRVKSAAAPIKETIEEWAKTNRNYVTQVDDLMEDLEFLEDREDEIWSPLFVVLSLISPQRYGDLKKCAVELTSKKAASGVDNELALKLLADIRGLKLEVEAFDERDCSGKLVTSGAFLVAKLVAITESPWNDPKHTLTERGLARMLRPFEVFTRLIRVRERAGLSRYFWDDFEAVFSAYLAPKPESMSWAHSRKLHPKELHEPSPGMDGPWCNA